MEYLKDGGKTQAQIASHTSISVTSISQMLRRMIKDKEVRISGEKQRSGSRGVPTRIYVLGYAQTVGGQIGEANPLKDITRENLLVRLEEIISNPITRNEQKVKSMELQNKILGDIIQGFDRNRAIFIVTNARKFGHELVKDKQTLNKPEPEPEPEKGVSNDREGINGQGENENGTNEEVQESVANEPGLGESTDT